MMQQMGQVETVDMLIPQDKVGLVIGEKTLLLRLFHSQFNASEP